MNADALRAAGRNPPAPTDLTLDHGESLTIESWLRILPGKRLTGYGRLGDQAVVAKLFIAKRGSKRHWQRERDGSECLRANGIPGPHLLAAGTFGTDGHYAVFEHLPGMRSPDVAAPTDLHRSFEMLGRLHAKGIVHEDAHPDNFLLDADSLYVIDGDAIRKIEDTTDKLNNLALLFAQLPMAIGEALRNDLLAAYRSGNPGCKIDATHLDTAIANARRRRTANYLDKCLRDSTEFFVSRDRHQFLAMLRKEVEVLAPIVAAPDHWLEAGIPLKQGRTATLALVESNGRQLVIKRYNIKGVRHALSRCWRPSRAWHSWIEGHRLQFLGIATPRPLALVERRFGPLRGTAWLITEYCPGESLADRFASSLATLADQELAAIKKPFSQLVAAHISHGDLKASNLLWHESQVSLIDLDAMQQHKNIASFARAWRKDRERFLRNWPETSALHAALDAALP